MRLREIRESDAQAKGESDQIASDTAQKSKQKSLHDRRTLPPLTEATGEQSTEMELLR
jgi:hypothetical protein